MISVIVPIYQIEEYLEKCIESIRRQTYRDLEIILVDDGSTDGSSCICDLHAEQDSRIKVIHKTNGGLVSARIAGIKIASGEYVTYVDGDDWIDADYYERLIKKADKYHADIVASGFTKNIGEIELPNCNVLQCGYYSRQDIEEKILPVMFYDKGEGIPGLFTYVWNKLFRRELLYNHQVRVDEDISIGEDAACVYPAILSANSLYIDECEGYHYRQRTGSMLKQYTGIEAELPKLKKLFDYLMKHVHKTTYGFSLKCGLTLFLKYMIASRTGGIYEYQGKLNSAYGCKMPSQIIIYGAGNIGQHLYGTITSRSIGSIKFWIDPDHAVYREEGLPVDDITALKRYDGEDVFLAFLREAEIRAAVQEMAKYNIPKTKIHVLDIEKINEQILLG